LSGWESRLPWNCTCMYETSLQEEVV
jgi:hypothetical protein